MQMVLAKLWQSNTRPLERHSNLDRDWHLTSSKKRNKTSRDGAMTTETLQAAVEDALIRAKLEKKIRLSQVADRTLLMEAQRELGLK